MSEKISAIMNINAQVAKKIPGRVYYNRLEVSGSDNGGIYYIRAYFDSGNSNYIQFLCNSGNNTFSLVRATNGVETTLFSK